MAGIPLLPWEAPPLSNNIYASEIMSHPVVTLKTTENVGHIIEMLKCVTFNGFPVVDPPSGDHVHYQNFILFIEIYFYKLKNLLIVIRIITYLIG
jgi:hypothetical protein